MKGYFDQRAALRHQQAHLTSLEADQRSYIAALAEADTPEVLESRAREQGLVRPGERAFAIRGELDPPPPPVKEDDGGGGFFGWLSDLL